MAETLVIQPLPGIGDAIWHLPHMQSIAAQVPGGQISLLTKPRSQAHKLLKAEPYLDEVLWLERHPGRHTGMLGFWRLVAMLRQHKFRRVYILHHSATYAAAAFFAGIPERYGFGKGFSRYLLNRGSFLPDGVGKHPIVRADAFLLANGYEHNGLIPRLNIDSNAVVWAKDYLEGLPQPVVSFGIGSSEVVKQWGTENFSALARLIATEIGGTVLVFGGNAEKTMAEMISQDNDQVKTLINVDLQKVGALIAQGDAFVGNDTGLLNIASAVETPVVGILGNQLSKFLADPKRGVFPVYPPGGDKNMSTDSTGVASIQPEQVFKKIREVLV